MYFILLAISLFSTPAFAAEPNQISAIISSLPMILIFTAAFYFLMIYPQRKKETQRQKIIDSVNKGDEVLIESGIIGKVINISDGMILLNVANNVNIHIKREYIKHVLPKGTLKSLS